MHRPRGCALKEETVIRKGNKRNRSFQDKGDVSALWKQKSRRRKTLHEYKTRDETLGGNGMRRVERQSRVKRKVIIYPGQAHKGQIITIPPF